MNIKSLIMNRIIYAIAVIGALCAFSMTASAAYLSSLDIQAHIDGRDQLIIKNDTLQWHHFDFSAVGRHVGSNSPTIINGISTAGGGAEWIPDWPSPPPDEIRFDAFSSVLSGVIDPLPLNGVPWRVEKLFGRGVVDIVEQPSAANDFALVIEFNDNPQGGSTFYGVSLAGVPAPAAVWLFGSGLIGLVGLIRRKKA